MGIHWRSHLHGEPGQLKKAENWHRTAWTLPVAPERLGRLCEAMERPGEATVAYERFIAA